MKRVLVEVTMPDYYDESLLGDDLAEAIDVYANDLERISPEFTSEQINSTREFKFRVLTEDNPL